MPIRTTPPLTETVSAPVNDVGAGFVAEILEPTDDVLSTHGAGKLELYERLMRDSQVLPTFRSRREAVIARELKVDAASEEPIDVLAADSLRAQLGALAFDSTTYKMLAGLMFGYGVSECMWAVEGDGRIRLDDIRVRKAGRFKFAKDGTLRLQRGSDLVPLPERKMWSFSCGAEDDDDPYGRGLGHYLYWPVWFKRNALRFWALFLERFATPTPYAKVPVGTNKEDLDKVVGLLRSITNGGKVAIPQNIALDFLTAVRSSGGDYIQFVELQDKAIAKIVLGQTMTVDDGSSRAQGEVHAKVALVGAMGDSRMLCESFQRGPATWLTEWNFPGARTPIIYRDFAEPDDLAAAAEVDSKLGTFGYRPTAQRVAEVYGEGYELAPAPAAPATAAFAEPVLPTGSAAVAELVADDGWRRVIGPEVDAIEKLLDGARSLEEVRRRLGDVAQENPTMLVDGLSRVMFAASIAGQAESPTEMDDDVELG